MHRKLTLLLVAGSLASAGALSACGSGYGGDSAPKKAAAPAATAPVKHGGAVAADIKDFAFAPQRLEVKVGQKVTWTNDDSAPHTVTAQSGAKFDSGALAPGASYSWVAKRAGTIAYVCAIHPSMTGTITVS